MVPRLEAGLGLASRLVSVSLLALVLRLGLLLPQVLLLLPVLVSGPAALRNYSAEPKTE